MRQAIDEREIRNNGGPVPGRIHLTPVRTLPGRHGRGDRLAAAIGAPALAQPEIQTKYRDRINLPGVRITREYIKTDEAGNRSGPSAAKPKPPVRRASRSRADSSPGVTPQAGSPLPGATALLPLDLVDRLFAAVNRTGIHDVYFEGDETVYGEDGAAVTRPFRATLAGSGGCRVESGEPGPDEVLTLLSPEAAWRIEEGIATPLNRDALPEFAPYLPAVSIAWALRQMCARDALVLLDRGRETFAGQPCRVVEAVHRGDETGPASVLLPGRRPGRTYRLWLDDSRRLVRLDYRGLSWRYENYVRIKKLGLLAPLTVRGYARGVHEWDRTLDPRSFQAIEPPDPALFEPGAELAAGLLKLGDGEFSAETIWNENRPDTMGGDAPFGVFHGDSVASVNVQSLNLNVTVKLADYPQRGAVGLPVGLTYNSKLWDVEYAFSESRQGSAKMPGRIDFYDHVYSRGSADGWNNLAGLYTVDIKKEHYDHLGRGVPYYLKSQPWSGEVPKILEKAYLHTPDGAVHELMDVDDGDGDAGEVLQNPYTADGCPAEIGTRTLESVDGSQIQLRMGNRGRSHDLLRFENAAGTFLLIANEAPGIRVLRRNQGVFEHPEPSLDFDTPWAATRLLPLTGQGGVPYLLAGTGQAGVQLYDLSGFPDTVTRIPQRYLNDQSIIDLKLQEDEQRLWVLASRLTLVDVTHPEDGKVRAGCALTAAPSGDWASDSAPLEVSGDHAYVAAGNGIDVYYYNGVSLTHQERFVAGDAPGAVHAALVRDGDVLYSLARVSGTDVRLLRLNIAVNGQLTQAGSLSLPHAGRRMVIRDGRLYVLGHTWWEAQTGEICTAVEIVDLLQETVASRTVFGESYQPRSAGLAFSADGAELYLTGLSHGCAAYATAAFLDGAEPLWEDRPVYEDPTIFFPDGSRVVLAPGEQRRLDASGNCVRVTEPDPFHGIPYSSYEDTLGRAVAQAPVAFNNPLADGQTIPYVAPGTPPEVRGLDLPGYTVSPPGYERPFSLVYQPLSDFLGGAPSLTTRGTDVILDPELFPCQGPPPLFSGSSYMSQHVVNPGCYNPRVLARVVLPTGRSYSFEYNKWGEMTKLTYPTGGYERFEHGVVPPVGWHHTAFQIWANRGVQRRFISPTGESAGECVYVYKTEQQNRGGVAWDDPPYIRVVRRVEFYASAAAYRSGAEPDAMEEHYFYRVDKSGLAYLVPYGLAPLYDGKEYETRLHLKTGDGFKLHRRTLREYRAGVYNPAPGNYLVHPRSSFKVGWRNPLVTAELTMLCDAAGTPRRTALTTRTYERPGAEGSYFKYNRLTEQRTYDYAGGGDLLPYEPKDGLAGRIELYFGGAAPLRVERTDFLDDDDPAYEAYEEQNLVQLPARARVEDGAGTAVSEAVFTYDGEAILPSPEVTTGFLPPPGTSRGNLTGVSRWLDGATWAADRRLFDQYGHVVRYIDPEGQTTDWEYAGGDYRCAFVTAALRHPGETLELRAGYEYDPVLGRLMEVRDPNDTPGNPVAASFVYDDTLGRLTGAVEPGGRNIALVYDDEARTVHVVSDHEEAGDGRQEVWRHFDGLGRLTAEGVKTGSFAAPSWRWAQKEYDAKGRLWKVYNPTPAPGTDQVPFTLTAYDSLDRVTRVTNPDGTHRDTLYDLFDVPSATPAVADRAADEDGKWRQYSRDAAGQIVQVIEQGPAAEAAGPVTTYAYTAAGKLAEVRQDAQVRSFAYDGLGHLVRAEYPEIDFPKTWEYYANGQLRRELCGFSLDEPPRPQWVEYQYDALGRVNRKYHVAGDSGVETILRKYVYVYDGVGLPAGTALDPGPYPLGRLTGKWEVDPADAGEPGAPWRWLEAYAYDESGRPAAQLNWLAVPLDGGENVFETGDCLTGYAYNVSGGLTAVTYPSGKQAAFTLDLENKPVDAGTEGGRAVLASALTYALHGALETVTVPFADEGGRADLTYRRQYVQPTLRVDRITLGQAAPGDLMDFQYAYEGNGNVSGIAHADFGGVHTESFAYDNLNRLTGVDYALAGTPGAGSIGYAYDRFGNLHARDVQLPEGAAGARSFDFGAVAMGARNRLPETAGPFAFSYDERGNLTGVSEQVGEDDFINEDFGYDPENRLERYHRWWRDPESGLPLESEAEYLYNDSFQRVFAYWSITHTSREYDHDSRTATIYLPGGEVLTELIRESGTPFPEAVADDGTAYTGGTTGGAEFAGTTGSIGGAGSDRREDRDWSGEAYHYQFTDHLGSTRFVAGTSWQWGAGDAYLETDTWLRPVNLTPYGSELRDPSARYTPDSLFLFDPILFTGKPRDVESGLDYFGARFYSDRWCRWVSPDQPFGDNYAGAPQSWNMYSYARNCPISNFDPDGAKTATTQVVPKPAVEPEITVEVKLVPQTGQKAASSAFSGLARLVGPLLMWLSFTTDLGSPEADLDVGDRNRQFVEQNQTENSGSADTQAEAQPSTEGGSKGSGRPGTRGNPDHRTTADEEATRIKGDTEVKVLTPKGNKSFRRVDAGRMSPTGQLEEGVQVVRPKPNGTIPKREIDAARDIEEATGVKPEMVPVRPLPKEKNK